MSLDWDVISGLLSCSPLAAKYLPNDRQSFGAVCIPLVLSILLFDAIIFTPLLLAPVEFVLCSSWHGSLSRDDRVLSLKVGSAFSFAIIGAPTIIVDANFCIRAIPCCTENHCAAPSLPPLCVALPTFHPEMPVHDLIGTL